MKEVVSTALDAAQIAGATYADVRVVDTTHEEITVANGRVEGIESATSFGIGIRVICDGAWGFAAVSRIDGEHIAETARGAVAIARASALAPATPVRLSDTPAAQDSWRGACEIDPFSISVEEKLALLLAVDEVLRAEPTVKLTKAHLGFYKVHKFFGSTEGSLIEPEYVESGAGIVAQAIGDGEVLPRSYPNSHGGAWNQGGWETILALDLLGNAARVAEEAAALLSAPHCQSGTTDLIIDASQLALQVHESVGHPTELDRVLGDEAAFAGTSFLDLRDLDEFRYGSEHITVTADATVAGSLGSYAYDDEGVPAQRDYLIRDGLFSGFLTSRESALTIGRTSNACMRADGWN
ncbi:MAG: TldD/PmbA family protein, partial [Coriobacteriia bacterium]|nr:TldD/PmbA family protein [Coriobacteriia bacterium]